MFSLDNFYYVLYQNFLQPYNMSDLWFYHFGSVHPDHLGSCIYSGKISWETKRLTFFYDQEPLLMPEINALIGVWGHRNNIASCASKCVKILANSEHSALKNSFLEEYDFVDWYYFFHGFAALEWFRDFKYIPKLDSKFSKVFMSLNHLVTKDRSYRLNLIANLKDRDLLKYGSVSCQLKDLHGDWKHELLDRNSKLSTKAKKLVWKWFNTINHPLVVDTEFVNGTMSAKMDLAFNQSALWHVVSETVFYHDKLHLTEKIFKPIVARRPFILVGAPGNLAYLKSYGFKTFDRWIDENYDHETDPDARIEKIVTQVEKLCQLSEDKLIQMHQEMQEVLDYNFNHFYGKFKELIVVEMVNNFETAVKKHNVKVGYLLGKQLDLSTFDRDQTIKRLSQ